MHSEMKFCRWTRVWILLGIQLARTSAYLNTSSLAPVPADKGINTTTSSGAASIKNVAATVTTSFPSTTSTPTFPTTNASCGSVNFNTYLVPSLQSLPSSALEAYLASGYQKLNNDFANLERYANSPITDTVAYESYLFAELSTISADIESLYGPPGHGILSFSNIATTDPCLFTACLNSYLALSSAVAPSYSPGVFDFFLYTAAPPCCGQCTIQATGVQLAYWPTPAPTPPVSVLVDQYNFSYVSPSVYVFLTSLNARNLCGPIGATYPLEISKFAPTALSTSSLATSFSGLGPALGVWEAIDYADFDSPKCKCTSDCQYDSIQHEYLTNICTPQLSMPPGVTLVDPLWSTCGTNLFGVFDPPIALTIQPGLTTPKNVPAQPTLNSVNPPPPPPPTSPVAANGPTATAPIPPSTAPPEPASVPPTVNPKPSSVPPPVIVPPASDTSAPVPPNSVAPPGRTQTLTAGGPAVTISGTVISLPPSAVTPPKSADVTTTVAPSLIINGQTVTANPQGNFVVGTQTFTTNSQGNIVVGSQTLTAGGSAITESGSTLSLGGGATEVIYDGTSTTHLGGIIQSFISAPAQYTGAAGKEVEMGLSKGVCMAVVFSALMVWL